MSLYTTGELVNLLEGYGNDNPGAKSQGMKQFMAGAGVMLIGALLVPKLKDLIPAKVFVLMLLHLGLQKLI